VRAEGSAAPSHDAHDVSVSAPGRRPSPAGPRQCRGDNAEVEFVPDHAIRLQAFREAFDRVYGKPRQAIEHTGAEGGPVELLAPEDARKRSEEAAPILMNVGALDDRLVANGNGHRE
jgi:hypothetical protein